MPKHTSVLSTSAPSPKSSIVDDLFELTAADSLETMLRRALSMTIRIAGAEAGSIFFMGQSTLAIQSGAFRPEALKHIQRWENKIGRQLNHNTWHMSQTATPIISQNTLPGSRLILVSAPLLDKTKVMGTISFVMPPGRPLPEHKRSLLDKMVRGIGQIAATLMELESTRLRLERIGVFYDLGQALVTTFDISKLLADTMELAAKLVDAGASSILLVDDSERELVFRVSHGARADMLRQHRIPMGEGIAGWVAHTGRPVIANDARADSRFSHRVDVRTGFLTQSIAAVPLKVKGRIIGVLELLNKYSGQGFNRDDVQIMNFIATQAAIAIENARLYHRLRDERDQVIANQSNVHRDIVGNLHDGVLQYLSAISLSLDHLKLLSAKNNPGVLEHQISALQNLVEQATRNTRNLLFELRPPILETHGLIPACKYYVEQLSNTGAFDIHLRARDELTLNPKQNVAIFSIVQEAINNVTRHANAQNVWLALDVDDHRLTVSISDDGSGFNLTAVENVHSDQKTRGIFKMKRLAEAINADLQIESSTQPPQQGTNIQLTLPLAEN